MGIAIGRPTREVRPDGAVVLRSERFTLVVTRLAPGRVLLTAIGYEDGGTFDLLTAELEQEVARSAGPVTIYCDLSEETGMSPDSRERWAQWAKASNRPFGETHILVRSKLVDMALSLIAMVTGGGMRSYTNAADFERAIAREVPSFRQLPRFPELVAERARRR